MVEVLGEMGKRVDARDVGTYMGAGAAAIAADSGFFASLVPAPPAPSALKTSCGSSNTT